MECRSSKVNRYGVLFKFQGILYTREYYGDNRFSSASALQIGEGGTIADRMSDKDVLVSKIEPDEEGVSTTDLAILEFSPNNKDVEVTAADALSIDETRKEFCEKVEKIISEYELEQLWKCEPVR